MSQEQKANKWCKVFLPNPVRVLDSVGVSDGFSVLDTVISACRARSLFCVAIGSVSEKIEGDPVEDDVARYEGGSGHGATTKGILFGE